MCFGLSENDRKVGAICNGCKQEYYTFTKKNESEDTPRTFQHVRNSKDQRHISNKSRKRQFCFEMNLERKHRHEQELQIVRKGIKMSTSDLRGPVLPEQQNFKVHQGQEYQGVLNTISVSTCPERELQEQTPQGQGQEYQKICEVNVPDCIDNSKLNNRVDVSDCRGSSLNLSRLS